MTSDFCYVVGTSRESTDLSAFLLATGSTRRSDLTGECRSGRILAEICYSWLSLLCGFVRDCDFCRDLRGIRHSLGNFRYNRYSND